MNYKASAEVTRMALATVLMASALTLALGPVQPVLALEGYVVTGRITDSNYYDYWRFSGSAGDVVTISMTRTSGDLDPYLDLWFYDDGSWQVLTSDDDTGGNRNALISGYTLLNTGTYAVGAKRYEGVNGRTTGSYRLVIQGRSPGFGNANCGFAGCGTDDSNQDAAVIVAVIDSGVDLDHPAFQGRLVNGYNFSRPGTPPDDNHGHGTNTAGIIAAVAPSAKIMPVVNRNGYGLPRAIRWAVENDANVINLSLSWSGECPSSVQSAVDYAIRNGVLVIAAVGNERDGRIKWPASCTDVIGVGVIDSDGNRYHSVNEYVDIVGVMPRRTARKGGGYHQCGTSTSCATPLVSAAAARLMARYPGYSRTQIENALPPVVR